MTTTNDQGFTIPTAGQADWDTDLNANLNLQERGYYITARAGIAISTGYACWMNSGGFMFPFNPNSFDLPHRPHAFSYLALNSGEQARFLKQGIVRSLDVLSSTIAGQPVFVSALTPGYIVSSYSGAWTPCGIGVAAGGKGIFFGDPGFKFPEKFTRTATITVGSGTTQNFSLDCGRRGWNRQVFMKSDSGNAMKLRLWSNSTRVESELLYETRSGGVSTVGSFTDVAGFPFENTITSSISGLIYGSIDVESSSAVTTVTVGITLVMERWL